MRKLQVLFVFLSVIYSFQSQVVSCNNGLHSPLGIPLELSATFGDIRPNHFHMGLDFRTNGREGISIYSIDNGYISRIKISPSGYGRVLYVNHPNGKTSVYAHCSAFSKTITDFILPIQRKGFLNEIDITLTKNQLPVKKGELIALSGNSGNSTGPHLHFELRQTVTELALNPLKYGFSVKDTLPPILKAIKIYAIDENGYLVPGKSKIIKVTTNKKGIIQIPKDVIVVPVDFLASNSKLAFAISGNDPIGKKNSSFGLYENMLIQDKDTIFRSSVNRIAFDDSRYVNTHQDYDEYKLSSTKFHKLFKTKHNPLHIYHLDEVGSIVLTPKDTSKISIVLKDVNGNQTQLKFSVIVPTEIPSKTKPFYNAKEYFLPDSSYTYQNTKVRFDVPKHTFYEPCKKIVNLEKASIGDASEPIQNSIKVTFPILKSVTIEKQYIQVKSGGSNHALKTNWIGGKLVAESKFLGEFSVKIDTVPPTITTSNFKETDSLITKERMSWKVSDSQTDIVNYQIFVEGKWFPMEYDLKNKVLVFKRNPMMRAEQEVEIKVEDSCGNVAVWCGTLCFSELPQP